MEQIDFSSINKITDKIIGAAIEVHRQLGPGFLESVYEDALCIEFEMRGIKYKRQVGIDIGYKGKTIKGQRLDLLVEDMVIVENKAVAKILEVHEMVLISYLKATKLRIGLIINFHETILTKGIKRILLPEKYLKK